jgi:putative aldouronate transport system substrate-binding protein
MKRIALLLVLMMVLSSADSCSQQANQPAATAAPVENAAPAAATGLTAPGEFPVTLEKQEFDVMMVQWADQDPNTAWITEQYENMSNVHVNWTMIPDDGFPERVSISFASGDMPDVIAGMGGAIPIADEQQYAAQGLLMPLNDVIDRSSLYLKVYLDENPSVRKLIAQDDGEIYSLPGLAVCYHCNYSQKFFINSLWLENVGLSMPTTTDEFYNVLKAFKEQDANGNGDPDDEIPLITCTEGWHVDLDGFLMCSFIYSDPDTKMSVEDGQLIFTPIEEGYREGLRYLNKLYTDGLLSPESFTNDNATNSRLNTINVTDPKDWESPAAIIGSYPFAYQNYQGDTDIWKQYEIMPPLKGPDGFVTTPEYSLTRDVIRANMLITKNAENPDLIMRWVDWFYSFDGTFFRLGREGVDWRAAEPGELDFNGQPAKYNLLQVPEDDPYYNNVDWTQSIPVNYSQEYRESAVAASDFRDATISNGTEVQLFQGTIPYEAVARDVSQSIPGLNIPADLISDYGRIKTEIETYQENAMVQFITGTLSLDGDWDAYVNQLKSIGLDEYMEMSNDAYQAFLNR